MEELISNGHCWFSASCTSSPLKASLVATACAPVTTTTGRHPALTTTDAARLTNVCPQNCSNCFGLPIRVDGPARQNNCADAREISHMNTSSS